MAKTPNPQVLARVSLLASHERLREKRLCLAGVQAIKSRFFAPIYRKYLYILSYPIFLYYAESPKVPPRVFGPLGPKTLRGQQGGGETEKKLKSLCDSASPVKISYLDVIICMAGKMAKTYKT